MVVTFLVLMVRLMSSGDVALRRGLGARTTLPGKRTSLWRPGGEDPAEAVDIVRCA